MRTDAFEEPAGGGAVAAVQLARLAGTSSCSHGARRGRERAPLGAAWASWACACARPSSAAPTRRAVTLVDEERERTITTFGRAAGPGARTGASHWAELRELDCVYFTAGGTCRRCARARAAARVLVGEPARASRARSRGPLDALVLSAEDEIELAAAARGRSAKPSWSSTPKGRAAGATATARRARRDAGRPCPPPGAAVDSYGCGDSFAAGLTYGLGAGLGLGEALALAARCGATCLTGAGPYERQLTARELREVHPS